MKRFLCVIISAFCLILCLCACDLKHEHAPGEWKYTESEHWRLPECGRENCAVEDVVYDYGTHADQNTDGVCDVCGYAGVAQCPYCGNLSDGNRWFIAKVVSENGVKPLGTDCFEAKAAGSAEIRFNSADGTLAEGGFAVGDIVCITYGGYIMESYPVQISPISVERAEIDDLVLRPEDTELEFWIGENVDNVDFSKYKEKYGMFGGRQFYGTGYIPTTDAQGQQVDPEHYVLYTVTSYPDYSDKTQHITTIEITDPAISVYGLTVNSTFEEFESCMQREGFVLQSSNEYFRLAKKGKYSVSIDSQGITIRVEVENKNGIVF